MSITLPWFWAADHLAAGSLGPQAIGQGSWDYVGGSSQVNVRADFDGRRVARFEASEDHRLTLDTPVTEIVVGFNYVNNSVGTCQLWPGIYDASGAMLAYARASAMPGVIQIYQGSTKIWEGGVTANDVPHYYEFSWKLRADTSGAFAVQVDGVPVHEATGIRTAANANPASYLIFEGSGGYSIGLYADFYIKERSLVDAADFNGPVAMIWLPVDADVSANMTPLTGPTNYTELDDPTGQDGDTSYVETGVVDTEDEYGLADLTADPTRNILAVIPVIVAQDPGSGGGQAKLGLTDGVDTYLSDPLPAGGGAYNTVMAPAQTTQPDGVSEWDDAAVNALHLTQRLVAAP